MTAEDTVFMDEAGCNTSMARSHARSPAGERARCRKPAAKGKNVTIIGAIGLSGLLAVHSMVGAMTKPDFVAFLRDVLFPRMRPGQALVMDNLRAHHSKEVKELAKSFGIVLVFVPPYSPDFNPIEHAWSKLKAILRAIAARTERALHDAIKDAAATITSSDFLGWARHCGYPF